MIVVIGAGPAGLAAAEAASRKGASVTILDSASRIGGQYWRHRNSVTGYRSHRAELFFNKITSAPSITHMQGSTVWSIEKVQTQYRINFLQNGEEKSLHAEKVILATGAYDRTLPFPGWDELGSMTPGAAQATLKGHGVLVGKRIIVAGTGPFLLPVATGLAEAGAEVVALCEAHSPLRWLLSPFALILNPSKFLELLYYVRALRRFAIRPRFGTFVSSFHNGVATISTVRRDFHKGTRKPEDLEVDVVAVGWGFVPDVTLGGIAGCQQRVESDGTTVFAVNAEQSSTQLNIWIAGEATGIGGADLSLIEGEIAGLSASNSAIPFLLRFRRFRRAIFASALKRSYPVKEGWLTWPKEDTNICRCEEVKLSEIRDSVIELGAKNVRTSKLFTRAGMGLCQGRICSRNVSEIVSELTQCSVSDEERISSSNRPIAAPISLGLLGDGKK